MTKRIYVGNLPSNATAAEVCKLFGAFGTVEWVNLVTDADTGRSQVFGYLEMSSGAAEAVCALDHRPMGGRILEVQRALPPCRSRQRRPRRTRRYRSSGACLQGPARSEERRDPPPRQLAL